MAFTLHGPIQALNLQRRELRKLNTAQSRVDLEPNYAVVIRHCAIRQRRPNGIEPLLKILGNGKPTRLAQCSLQLVVLELRQLVLDFALCLPADLLAEALTIGIVANRHHRAPTSIRPLADGTLA